MWSFCACPYAQCLFFFHARSSLPVLYILVFPAFGFWYAHSWRTSHPLDQLSITPLAIPVLLPRFHPVDPVLWQFSCFSLRIRHCAFAFLCLLGSFCFAHYFFLLCFLVRLCPGLPVALTYRFSIFFPLSFSLLSELHVFSRGAAARDPGSPPFWTLLARFSLSPHLISYGFLGAQT